MHLPVTFMVTARSLIAVSRLHRPEANAPNAVSNVARVPFGSCKPWSVIWPALWRTYKEGSANPGAGIWIRARGWAVTPLVSQGIDHERWHLTNFTPTGQELIGDFKGFFDGDIHIEVPIGA